VCIRLVPKLYGHIYEGILSDISPLFSAPNYHIVVDSAQIA
jgi:hypothetical protein